MSYALVAVLIFPGIAHTGPHACFKPQFEREASPWRTIRGIFAQYKYPHDLDGQSQLISVAVLLLLFGPFGVHRFFVGKITSGILYFMTFGFLGIVIIVDGIMLAIGRFNDSDGNTI